MITSEQACSTDLIGRLPVEQKLTLLEMGKSRKLSSGEYIFKAGMPSEHIYIIVDGRAKIFELSSRGKEVIMWFCFPGEVFGLAEVWLGSQRDVFAQACSDMHVVQIRKDLFRDYLKSNPETAMLVIDVLAGRLRVLSDMVLNLTSIDVSTRLTKLLARLFQRYGKSNGETVYLDIPLTHQEMADMIGSCRQTVTATLGRLKKVSGIVIQRRKISLQARDIQHAAESINSFLDP